MANPEQHDDQEDPATPTRNQLDFENELPAHDSIPENQEMTSLIENWIDA
jgi:hypothetical protein